MSQIRNPPLPPLLPSIKPPNHLRHTLRNGLFAAIQTSRVSISLEDNLSISPDFHGFRGVLKPIQAHHIVAKTAQIVQLPVRQAPKFCDLTERIRPTATNS